MTSSFPSGTPSSAEPEELLVGRVVGPFGRIGEVKLLPLTDYPEHLAGRRALLLRWPDGRAEQRRVERARPHKGVLLFKFEGSDSIDDAEALRGAEVFVGREQAAPLPPGHHYVHEILGLLAVTLDGEEIGPVTEVIRGPANDVYLAGGLLIPATHDAIAAIDLENRRLVIRSREFLEAEEA
jgi:16S rRNA processing protein RimM